MTATEALEESAKLPAIDDAKLAEAVEWLRVVSKGVMYPYGEKVTRRILLVLDALAAREREHRAWEAMRGGVVWNVWRHDQTGVWSANRDDDTPAREWQANDPVDAVLAAKAAKGGSDESKCGRQTSGENRVAG